jgi:hypothetical protein
MENTEKSLITDISQKPLKKECLEHQLLRAQIENIINHLAIG